MNRREFLRVVGEIVGISGLSLLGSKMRAPAIPDPPATIENAVIGNLLYADYTPGSAYYIQGPGVSIRREE